MLMKKKEIKLLDISLFITIIFVFNIFVSIILTYNEKLTKTKQKPFFNKKEAITIDNTNRFILLIIAIIYVWITYQQYKMYQASNKKNTTTVSFINLIINEVQLISVIVIFLLPFIYPKDEEEEIEEIVFP